MKKTSIICIAAALAMTINTSAHADWGHHRGDFRPPMPMYERHHHRGGGWVGPAAVLAIAGLAIGATAYGNAYAAPAPAYPAPVYVQPAPVYSAPPARSGIWYYCGSSDQYYPYTNACPEGWQAVPAR